MRPSFERNAAGSRNGTPSRTTFSKFNAAERQFARAGKRQHVRDLMEIGVAGIGQCAPRGSRSSVQPSISAASITLKATVLRGPLPAIFSTFLFELKSQHLLECGGIERVHQRVPQRLELLSCECHLQTSGGGIPLPSTNQTPPVSGATDER